MGSSIIQKGVFGLGVIILFHTAYSLQQYRALLLDLQDTGVVTTTASSSATTAATIVDTVSDTNTIQIPLDIYVELCIAFGMILLSELVRAKLQPVSYNNRKLGKQYTKPKRMTAPSYITRDFDIYTTTR